MLPGLKIAVRKQKKLIAIFLLTVFIPSAALSIFGLIALRNEQYKIEKQAEEDQSRIAELFKSQIRSKISEIEYTLQHLVLTPPLIERDYPAAEASLMGQSVNPLLEQFFVVYPDSDPWFPPLRNSAGSDKPIPSLKLNSAQLDKLREAEQNEFIQNNYKDAISGYKILINQINDKNDQAQFLNHIARNQIKLDDYKNAINTYLQIILDYPGITTSSGIPLSISARMELVSCYQKTGDEEGAIRSALDAFSDVLNNWGNLSIDQFNSYTSTINETFNNLITVYPESKSDKTKYQ
ncbi:MAG: hypothetical protein NTV01_13805, partial [Bacteroidia bacterium]|nr:hypothetical protein [Bacteroidia bacterium]